MSTLPSPWVPGESGKGFIFSDGRLTVWAAPNGVPHHADVVGHEAEEQGVSLYIETNGTVNGYAYPGSPGRDFTDEQIQQILSQRSPDLIWEDARNMFANAWTVQSAIDEKAWTAEYLRSFLNDELPTMPDHTSKFGGVTVHWEEIEPKVALVYAEGGSVEDRHLAQTVVFSDLAAYGYDRAAFYFPTDPSHKEELSFLNTKTAAWSDIMAKAKRLINSGQVQLLRNGYNNIVSRVVGDHGEYTCEIGRDDPQSRAITTWECECPWDQFAWGRTRQWKKYEGRPCAHVLATFWQAQSAPLDSDAAGQPPTPGQRGPAPQVPADITQPTLPGMEPEPTQPQLPVQQVGPATMPQQPGTGPDILPPFPGQQMELMPPGQIPEGQEAYPGVTVSVPGGRMQSPTNPMQNPSTYSKVSAYENGDMVRLKRAEYGVMEGKSEAHGAGQYKEIPAGSVGEVLGEDPMTGWVDVIFAGPQADAGPLEPFHVRAFLESKDIEAAPDVRKPGPFIRRR